LGGPRQISMIDLNRWIAQTIGRERSLIAVPPSIASTIASLGWLPGAPITRDQYAMLQSDNVVAAGSPGLAELGVSPTPMEAVAGNWLVRYRRHGRFAGRAKA
jgi:NADH dehydrogenase